MGKIKGVYEWAEKSYNIDIGCPNGCRYCYARSNANRFGYKKWEDWTNWEAREGKELKRWRMPKKIMIPSTHDIHEGNIDRIRIAIMNMINDGCEVLIVTKPRLNCIRKIIDDYSGTGIHSERRKKITFRFTIGSAKPMVLDFWEPNAPDYFERKQALKLAFNNDFNTSVSIEPYLDASVPWLIKEIQEFVTDTIWIGKMNDIEKRVLPFIDLNKIDENTGQSPRSFINIVKINQTDEKVMKLYSRFNHHPKIRWKDSIQEVLKRNGVDINGSKNSMEG